VSPERLHLPKSTTSPLRILNMTDDELRLLVTTQLDTLEFLDLIGMDFGELVQLVFEDLNEDAREELVRAVG
jgi:hypothetical protein